MVGILQVEARVDEELDVEIELPESEEAMSDEELDVEIELLEETEGETSVRISKRKGEKAAILTTGEDNKISFRTTLVNFPGCNSLRYVKKGKEFIVFSDEIGYCPPEGGWGDRTYYFKYAKDEWWKKQFYNALYIFVAFCIGALVTSFVFQIVMEAPSRLSYCFMESPVRNYSGYLARNCSGF